MDKKIEDRPGKLKERISEKCLEMGLSGFETKLILSRFRILPLEKINRLLPEEGNILEIGSGHGILSIAMASMSDSRKMLGLDMSRARVEIGEKLAALLGLSDVIRFMVSDARIVQPHEERYDALLMAEVLYLIPFGSQEEVLSGAAAFIDPGSAFVIYEPIAGTGFGSFLYRSQSRLLTALSMSRSGRKLFGYRVNGSPFLRTKDGLLELVQQSGFDVNYAELSGTVMYPHLLIRAVKK